MTIVELEYICEVCGQPIADREGCLEVSFEQLHQRRERMEEWRRSNGSGSGKSAADILAIPPRVPWRIHHDGCPPRPGDDGGYDVDVEQVRTWRDLLLCTAKLMDKTWLPETNWHRVIEAAARGTSREIVTKRPADENWSPTRGLS